MYYEFEAEYFEHSQLRRSEDLQMSNALSFLKPTLDALHSGTRILRAYGGAEPLAGASRRAPATARSEDSNSFKKIDASVNTLAAKLWNLTKKELDEVQCKLADLAG